MKHSRDLLFLALLSIPYVLTIFRYQANPYSILIITAIFSGAYLLWGLFHHFRQGNLHGRVVLEYALVSLLGIAIISTLLV